MKHHFPKPNGDRLYFKRNQTAGLGCFLGTYLFWGISAIFMFATQRRISNMDVQTVTALCAFPVLGLLTILATRGKDWAIDRRSGELLQRGHFMGISSRWKPYGKFDPQGTLCLGCIRAGTDPNNHCFYLLYQAPLEKHYTMLAWYHEEPTAQDAQIVLKNWEPRLTLLPELSDPKLLSKLLGFRVSGKRILMTG